MLSRVSAMSPSQRVPAWVSTLVSVLMALLKRSFMRCSKGLISRSTRLIQPSTNCGGIQRE